ncbi:hypothetical protein D3C81_1936970 [compost metagenome]
MHGAMPCPGVIAQSAEGIANAAVQLYRDPARWTQAQDAGLALLENRYRQQVHGPALIDSINACRADLAQRRRDNFTGSMLRHHQHKSTQYMSQWIEEKNRNG